jgi:hypothetical protein
MTQTILKRASLALPLIVTGVFASASAFGGTISLDSGFFANSSFETAPNNTACPAGWTCGDTVKGNPGFATSYTPTSAEYVPGSDGLSGGLIVPDGVGVATMPSPVEGSGSISQILAATYQSGSTYTLDLWIGTPLIVPSGDTSCSTPQPPCAVAGPVGTITAYFLGNGGAVLKAVDLSAPTTPGKWALTTLTFDPAAFNAVGQTIGFTLFVEAAPKSGGSGNDRIADFDIAAVPEPATFALFGLGLLGLGMARKVRAKR